MNSKSVRALQPRSKPMLPPTSPVIEQEKNAEILLLPLFTIAFQFVSENKAPVKPDKEL